MTKINEEVKQIENLKSYLPNWQKKTKNNEV